MRLEADGQVEDDVFLVVDQDKAVTLVWAELHSFEDVCIVVEGFLAEAQLGLALDEVRKHVDVEGDRSKHYLFRSIATEAIGMHFP